MRVNKTKEKQLTAVAINNEKGSHHAFKWAIDKLLAKNATIIHVKSEEPSLSWPASNFAPGEYFLYIRMINTLFYHVGSLRDQEIVHIETITTA